MICPNCGYDNIAGVDLCEACGTELAGMDLPEAGAGLGGRLLTDLIGDLSMAPTVTASPDEAIAEVVQRMRDEGHGFAMIVEDGRLSGIFTERDVLSRVVRAGLDVNTTAVREVMTTAPVTLASDDPPAFAVHRMVSQEFRHLPIVNGDELVGLLSIRGVLSYIYQDVLGGEA